MSHSNTTWYRTKCFHVELAESPSRSKLVIWSRDRGAAAHSATIRWKHIAIEALSLVHCPETDQAIRRGLLLLSHPITSIELGDFTAISFSHDGRYAAIAREDLYVNIIELATGQVRSRFRHNAPVTLMNFDATATYLATVSKNRTVSVWKVSKGIRHFSYQESQRPTLAKFSLQRSSQRLSYPVQAIFHEEKRSMAEEQKFPLGRSFLPAAICAC